MVKLVIFMMKFISVIFLTLSIFTSLLLIYGFCDVFIIKNWVTFTRRKQQPLWYFFGAQSFLALRFSKLRSRARSISIIRKTMAEGNSKEDNLSRWTLKSFPHFSRFRAVFPWFLLFPPALCFCTVFWATLLFSRLVNLFSVVTIFCLYLSIENFSYLLYNK